MIQQDFYTGEPVNSGSPNNFQNPNIINTGPTAESEAASMASFGKYDYDPSMRQATVTMPVQLTGGFGGTFNPYPNGGGIGAPPPPQFGGIPPYGYSPYGYYNPQPTYNYYRPYPTGDQMQFPPQQPCQTFQQPTTCHIPGINFSGEYLPPADYEQRITEMQMEYFSRQQELEAKQEVDRQSSVYGYGNMYGYNYYGIPYYNPYQYNALNNEFQSRIKAMQDEARENRLKFNLNIFILRNFVQQFFEMFRRSLRIFILPCFPVEWTCLPDFIKNENLMNIVRLLESVDYIFLAHSFFPFVLFTVSRTAPRYLDHLLKIFRLSPDQNSSL